MTPIEQLKSVLCDPEGKCLIAGSDEDRAIVDRALQELALQELAQPPLPVQPAQEQWKCVGPPCKCNASNAKQCCYAVFTKPPLPVQPVQEPVAEVKPKMTGGNVGIATVIHEIYSPHREPLQPGDKLYTASPLPAQPAQERQWIWLSDADISEVVDTTCQYTGSYEEFLIKKAERKIRSMNNG